ncbi:MAG: hypothetical protein HZB71_14780 [Betaproteobacteria bacterium]|nr:hypothetical protein [Betaproteobacteria bacterium]
MAVDEAEARNAAEVMVRLWQSPERQAESLLHHARAHYLARASQEEAISRIGLLLGDFVEWKARQTSGEPKPAFLGCLHHDFDQENWDWAIARLLQELPGYRERVPASYAVARELNRASPGEGNRDEVKNKGPQIAAL